MKEMFKKWKWLPITASVLFFVVGLFIAICVWVPSESGGVGEFITKSLGYIIAGLIFLVGGVTLAISLLQKPMKLDAVFFISVVILSISGLLFYIVSEYDSHVLSNIIIVQGSVFIFSIALFLTMWAIKRLIPKNSKKVAPIFSIIGATLLVTGGVLLLIYSDEAVIQHVAICVVGVIIVLAGIYILFVFIRSLKRKEQETHSTTEVDNAEEVIIEELQEPETIDDNTAVCEAIDNTNTEIDLDESLEGDVPDNL